MAKAIRGGVMIDTFRRETAKRLRNNQTPHERALWLALKRLPMKGSHFRRQAPIGKYVVDFLCPALKLVVEIDGGHHNEAGTEISDIRRQRWLESEGYTVLRFWNSEITSDMEAVLSRIYASVYGSLNADTLPLKHRRRSRTPSTPPRPLRGRPSPSRGG